MEKFKIAVGEVQKVLNSIPIPNRPFFFMSSHALASLFDFATTYYCFYNMAQDVSTFGRPPPKVGSLHFRATNIVLSVQMLCCAKTPCWTLAQHFRAKTQCRASALHFRATNAVSDLSTAFSCEIAVSNLSTAFSRENAVSDLSTAFSRENAVLDLSTTFSC